MHGLQNHSDVQNDVIRSLMADCNRLAKNTEEIHYWARHFGVDEAAQAIEHLKNHKLDQEKAKQAKCDKKREEKKHIVKEKVCVISRSMFRKVVSSFRRTCLGKVFRKRLSVHRK